MSARTARAAHSGPRAGRHLGPRIGRLAGPRAGRHLGPRRAPARAVLLLAVLLLVAGWVTFDPATASAAPLGKYGGTLSFRLTGVDPLVVSASSGTTLTVTGSYRNTGKGTITDLGYKFQRGDPLDGTAAIRKEAADPQQQYAVVDSGFRALPGTLKAGASAAFTASVPIAGSPTSGLNITRPGVYPIMINVNGTLHLPDGEARARVGELHLMLTVLAVPSGDTGGTTIPDGPGAGGPGIPFSMLWPIVDVPHLGVDGVFTDDDLTAEISPGGRLAALVDTLAASDAKPGMVTLVIDPMLLDELDRMTRGYWVVASPGTPQAALTPTPTPTTTSTAPTTASSAEATSSSSAHASSSAVGTGSAQSLGTTAVTDSAGTPSTQANPTAPGPAGSPAAASSVAGAPNSESAGPAATSGTQGSEPPDAAPSDSTATEPPSPQGQASSSRAPSTRPPTPESSGAATTPPTESETPGSATGSGTPTPETSGTGTSSAVPAEPGPRPAGTVAGRGAKQAAAFLDQLRSLARIYQVLALPYADPDVVAMVRAGMTGDLAAAVYQGRAVASRVLALPASTVDPTSNLVTTVAFPPDGLLDEATLRALRPLGYDAVVLSTSGITAKATTPSGAIPVALGSHSVPALISDASLAPDISSFVYNGVPTDWAERVNLLAALLAQQHFDGTGSPVVLVPDRDWSPAQAGFGLITSLLRTLGNQGVVTGTSLTDLASTAAGKPAAARLDYPASAQRSELSPAYLDSLQAIERRITVLGNALTAGIGPGGADPADILQPLQDAMLPAMAVSLRGATDPDRAALTTVTATLDSLYGGVQIRRSGGSYTLASSSAPLLLTVQNTLPYEVTVGITILGGGRSGLITDDPGRIDIAAGPRTKPVKIPARVSRSGTFTVFAQLHGPDGDTWGPPVPLTIASRAYGPLTLVLMLVAGGILVLMVAFRIHQRWRNRHPPSEPAP